MPEHIRIGASTTSTKLTRNGGETLYVIEAEQGGQEVGLYYAEDGILVREILDAEDGDYHEYFPQTPSVDIESWVKDNLGADARIVDFDSEDGRIEVEVIAGGLKHEVLFSADSQWLQTTTEYEGRTLELVPRRLCGSRGKASRRPRRGGGEDRNGRTRLLLRGDGAGRPRLQGLCRCCDL